MVSRDLDHRPGGDLTSFLDEVRRMPPHGAARGRLIFAMDATASRQPSWDRAMEVQGRMFEEAQRHRGLDVQLVYYRGFHECRASPWVADGQALLRLMTGVSCRAGQTQIGRVLRHAAKQAEKAPVQALVLIGDAVEEGFDELAGLAGDLGLKGVRAFLFQEGRDPGVERVFREVARLSGGAFCRFDASAPGELRDLLAAVAAFAAGGRPALDAVALRSPAVALIASQLR